MGSEQDIPVFRLGLLERLPGGLYCVITEHGGDRRSQRLRVLGPDCAITYEPPEAAFTPFLKKNEYRLRKILSLCMAVDPAEEIDIPVVFPEERGGRACPGNALPVYTDGSLSPAGTGGWAGIIVYAGGRVVERAGSERGCSSNRAELLAVVRTLECVEPDAPVLVHTDSRYVIRGAEVWLPNWERNGYFTALNRPVKNRDLWERVAVIVKEREVHFRWVPASGDNGYHRRCDMLARDMSLSPA